MTEQPDASRCTRCGAEFECGMETGSESCWCSELPPVQLTGDPSAGCLCPECLRSEVSRQGLSIPLANRERDSGSGEG